LAPLGALLGLCLSCAPHPHHGVQESTEAQTPSEKPRTLAAETPTPEPPAPAEGQDFGADARLAYQVVTCSSDETLPEGMDVRAWRQHCAVLVPLIEGYKKRYLSVASSFLAPLRPPQLPRTVVYPFGGGDLLSALTTYPEATEITTLSLELSGDPRRVRSLRGEALASSLSLIRRTVLPLLTLADSTSENLQKGQRGEIPGQLAFFFVALAVHGQEIVSLRYFRIEPDGGLHYYSAEEIAAGDRKTAASLGGGWTSPDFAPIFANAEIGFRPRGSKGPVRIHRHIGANLADGPLRRDPSVLRHLQRKGRVAAMTKAASYLLWRSDFALVRQYLLDNMDFMVSDSTGIPPSFVTKAGFVQETYGAFQGSFLSANQNYNDDFRKLWSSEPRRPLPFRYGYPDSSRHYHLLVTRRVTS
jgi:hypothetical protein